MKKYLYFLLVCTGCIIGCKKKEATVSPVTNTSTTSVNEARTGGLKGVISPAASVLDITAAIVVNGQFVTTTIKPNADGSFMFKDLPKGSGGLTFTTAVGYTASSGISISITGGKDTDLGIITIPLTPGSLSGTISPAGASSQITIKSTNSSGYAINIFPDSKTGNFKWENLPVGTYTLSCTANYGYAVPASRTVTITTAHNTDAGTIQFDQSIRGSISGTISPAGSVASVTATYAGVPMTTYTAVPDASGAFKLPNVVAGNYLISVKPASSSLYAPFDKTVTVIEGRNSDVGAIVLTVTPPLYSFSAMMDGSLYNNNSALGTYAADHQSMSITSYINGGSFTINIDGVSAPGEYACNSSTNSYISFLTVTQSNPGLADGSVQTINVWSTKSTIGNGVIKITSIDQVNKTISGTFSGTLFGTGGLKTVTNGVLTNVPFK